MKSKDYFPFEEVSPYSQINKDRLENTKEDFKIGQIEINEYIKNNELKESELSLLDAGCANGEFLYFLNKKHLDISKVGVDLTPLFIEKAKSLGLENCKFLDADLFEFSKLNINKFDIVTCFSVVQIFQDPSKIISCLFEMVKPGGLLIAQGCFNRNNIGVNVKFLDKSVKVTKDQWRSDFNQHTYESIEELGKKFSDKWDIKHFDFEADIPKVESAPAINNWTIDLANGKKLIVNGANLIIDTSYLVAIKK